MKNVYDHHEHQDIYTYNLSVPKRFTLDVPITQSVPPLILALLLLALATAMILASALLVNTPELHSVYFRQTHISGGLLSRVLLRWTSTTDRCPEEPRASSWPTPQSKNPHRRSFWRIGL